MNKKDYVELHRLLAILKYELETDYYSSNNEIYLKQLKEKIAAIDVLMNVFIVECEG